MKNGAKLANPLQCRNDAPNATDGNPWSRSYAYSYLK